MTQNMERVTRPRPEDQTNLSLAAMPAGWRELMDRMAFLAPYVDPKESSFYEWAFHHNAMLVRSLAEPEAEYFVFDRKVHGSFITRQDTGQLVFRPCDPWDFVTK